jgi:peptidoglycan/LPS O-acetylase OafA/YrhL
MPKEELAYSFYYMQVDFIFFNQLIYNCLFLQTSELLCTTLMRTYLFSLDYLRGIAAISVCLFHFTDKLDYLPDTDLIKNVFGFGHYGVEVFFIISGLVIPFSMEKGNYMLNKFFVFIRKRFIRIEPPYLICVLLALFLNYLTTLSPFYIGKPFQIDFEQLLYHIGYLNAFMGKDWLNQVFWTLAIEFQYYLLIALIFPIINHPNKLICISALVVFNILSLYSDRNVIFNFSIFFTCGIILYRYIIGKLDRMDMLWIGSLSVLFLFFRYSYIEVFVVIFTASLVCLPLRPTGFSNFFGNISYSLYLLHFPVGLRIINLTQRFSDSQLVRQSMVFIAFLFTVLISYYYYRFAEKPFKELSKKIKYMGSPSSDATCAPESAI